MSETRQTGEPAADARSPELVLETGRGRLLLVDEEPGRHAKRPADALLLLASAGLVLVAVLVALSTDGSGESGVVAALQRLLGWFGVGWRLIYLATLLLGVGVVGEALLLRRWMLLRDQLAAMALVAGVGMLVGRGVSDSWPSLHEGLLSPSLDFPTTRLSAVVAVLVVTGPGLVRPVRWLGLWLVLLSCPAVVVLGMEYPSSVLGGVTLGLAVAATLRFVLGSTAGFPSRPRTLAGLRDLGVPVSALSVAARQRPGAAVFDAVDLVGRQLVVVVVGRDAQDTQRVANLWRRLSLRDPGQRLAPGRRQQVEHESLLTLLAERGSVAVPEVVEVGLASTGDALLVLRSASGATLEELAAAQPDALPLEELWRQVARMQELGMSHGQLHLGNVVATQQGPTIVDFSLGQLSAQPAALAIDAAEMLVSSTVAVGPEPALAAASAHLPHARLLDALPYLQRAALTAHTRDRARGAEVKLDALRRAVAEAQDVPVPEVAELRRVKPTDVALMVLFAFAAYLLVQQLSEVGWGTIVDELSQAEWAWVVVALVVAQLTFVTQAFSVQGSTLQPLPLLPCIALEAAIKFVNLTIPTSAGRIAVNIRFLQRLGATSGQAVAAGVVDSLSELLVQVALFVLTLAFVASRFELPDDTGAASGEDPGSLLLVLVVAAVVAVVVVLAVPTLREQVLPTARSAFTALADVLRDRHHRVLLFGGNVATQVLFALALGASCHAYGAELSLAELIFVNTAVTVFAGILPVPGGVGVAEAGLTAGLTAFGIPASAAFAAALTHRLCSYYLPPIWGYLALRWLTRRGYV